MTENLKRKQQVGVHPEPTSEDAHENSCHQGETEINRNCPHRASKIQGIAEQIVGCLESQLTAERQFTAAAVNAQHVQELKQGLKEITVEPYSQDLILSTVFSQAVRPGESLEEREKRHERMSKEELTAEELEGAKAKLEVLKVAEMFATCTVRMHFSPTKIARVSFKNG